MSENQPESTDQQQPETQVAQDQQQPDTGNDAPDTEALRAEAEKWKALARKHEDRARENASAARELGELKRSQMNEQERAVQVARDEARVEVVREFGARLVDAKFEAGAAGRTVNGKPLDVVALLEGVNRAYYLTESGEVDADKVTRFLDGIAPKPDEQSQNPRFPDLGQGRRTSSKTSTGDQFAAAVETFFR